MKNTIKENLRRAEEARKEREAVKKAAEEAAEKAKALEELKAKYAAVPQKGLCDTISLVEKGELLPVFDLEEHLIGVASSEEDKEKMLNLYYSMGGNLYKMYNMTRLAYDFVDADLIPDHSIEVEGIEVLIKQKTAYDHIGNELANLNDIKSKLSKEDIDILLKDRVKQVLHSK